MYMYIFICGEERDLLLGISSHNMEASRSTIGRLGQHAGEPGKPMVQMKSKGSQLEKCSPLAREASLFALFRSSPD